MGGEIEVFWVLRWKIEEKFKIWKEKVQKKFLKNIKKYKNLKNCKKLKKNIKNLKNVKICKKEKKILSIKFLLNLNLFY